MKDIELKTLLDNLPVDTKITPSGSVLCKELGFTTDKFTTGGKYLDSAIYNVYTLKQIKNFNFTNTNNLINEFFNEYESSKIDYVSCVACLRDESDEEAG